MHKWIICCVVGDTAHTNWILPEYADNVGDLLGSITESQIPYTGGGTNLTAALSEIRQNVMSSSGGDRPEVPNVCILITYGAGNTDGFSAEVQRTMEVCHLIIINIGNTVSIQ